MNLPIRTKTRTTTCRKCGSSMDLDGRLMIGEVFDCGTCGATLEVANIEPLVLEPFAKIEEDVDDFQDRDWV